MRKHQMPLLTVAIFLLTGIMGCKKDQTGKDREIGLTEGTYTISSDYPMSFGVRSVSSAKLPGDLTEITIMARPVNINGFPVNLSGFRFYLKENSDGKNVFYTQENGIESGLIIDIQAKKASLSFYNNGVTFASDNIDEIVKDQNTFRMYTILNSVASLLFHDNENILLKGNVQSPENVLLSGTARMEECFYYITGTGFSPRGADINAGNNLGEWLDNHTTWECGDVSYHQNSYFYNSIWVTTYTVECENCD